MYHDNMHKNMHATPKHVYITFSRYTNIYIICCESISKKLLNFSDKNMAEENTSKQINNSM